MKDLPDNWRKGFDHPWKIGSDGFETPFLRGGNWYLWMWNEKDAIHYYYSFTDDRFYLNLIHTQSPEEKHF